MGLIGRPALGGNGLKFYPKGPGRTVVNINRYIQYVYVYARYYICTWTYIDGLRKAGDAPGHKIVVAVCVCILLLLLLLLLLLWWSSSSSSC